MISPLLASLAFSSTLAHAVPVQQSPLISEFVTLSAPDPSHGQQFGGALAIEQDTLVVGSIGTGGVDGAFYSFSRKQAGWTNGTKVNAPAGTSIFGRPLSLDGPILVVGDTDNSNSNGQSAGTAFVYSMSGTTWTYDQQLLASNGTQFDNFSTGLAIAGKTIVVGAPSANGFGSQSGAAYVFEHDGSTWAETQVLYPSQGGFGVGYGAAVDIDATEGRIVVGAPNESSMLSANVGAVYVFERTTTGWVEQDRISDATAMSSQGFGGSISLDGTRLLVGADGNDDLALSAGAAWIYELTGSTWTPAAKVYASDAIANYRFGHHVELQGDQGLISAFSSDPILHKIYHFHYDDNSGWIEKAALSTTTQAPFDGFGEIFDFDGGNLVLTGANGASAGPIRPGAAYVHLLDIPTASYCSGKTNSIGCVPATVSSGSPGFSSGPDDFTILASDCLPSKPGLLFFGVQGPWSTPFFNGVLCVAPPLVRTALQFSSNGTGCGGTYSILVSQPLMATYGLYPGTAVHGQYWMRDPQHPDGTGVGLSNGIRFYVTP